MSEANGNRFSAKAYRKRSAERQSLVEATWETNPETGNSFFLRRARMVGYLLAGSMPHSMTNEALSAWRDQGLEAAERAISEGKIDPKAKEAADRNIGLMAKVVSESCQIPRLVPGCSGENDEEIDPVDLEDSDIMFIFKFATGKLGRISLKGGEVVPAEHLQNFPERSGSSAGTGTGSEELQPSTE